MDSLNLWPNFSLTIEKAVPAPPAHKAAGFPHMNLLVLPQILNGLGKGSENFPPASIYDALPLKLEDTSIVIFSLSSLSVSARTRCIQKSCVQADTWNTLHLMNCKAA